MAVSAKHRTWCRFQSSPSEETGGATPVPIFLDRHDLSGLTASDIAQAHRKDLEVQDQYGVRFLTYWFDESRGTGFCLIDAPDIKTAMRVHDEAHGDVAKDVIEVDLSAVQAFLGRVSDPEPSGGQTTSQSIRPCGPLCSLTSLALPA